MIQPDPPTTPWQAPGGARAGFSGAGYLVLLLTALAGACALRFLGLTRWSLQGDELASALEVLHPEQDPFVLFRVMPLGYLPTLLSILAFGETHLGIRLGAAVCGALSLVVAAYGARRLWGDRCALTLTLLVGVSAWHIYFTQYGRFYAPAFLACTVFLFALLIGLEERRKGWLALAALAGGIIPYTHAHAVFFMAAVVATLGLMLFSRKVRPAALGLTSLALISGAIFALTLPWLWTVLRVAGRWAGGNDWNYGPVHTLLGLLNNLTLPLIAVAGIGIVLGLRSQHWQDWLILGPALGVPLIMMLLALRISIRQDYVFPGSIAIYLLGALAIEHLSRRSTTLWISLMLLALLPQLPGLISYYSCGNRFQTEAACAWIAERMGPHDMVVSDTSGLVRYYGIPERALAKSHEYLAGDRPATDAPAWLIQYVRRRPDPLPVDRWFQDHGRLVQTFKPVRYDYFEMETRIWRADHGAEAGKPVNAR